MADNNFAEILARFEVMEGTHDVIEREHTINDRLQQVYGDRAVHGDELGSTAGKYNADRRGGGSTVKRRL